MKRYAILALCLASLTAQAEPHYSKAYEQCLGKAASTAETVACIDPELKLQDKKLNDNYQTLKKRLNGKYQRQLQDVQRLWILYRNSNCKFFASPFDGSMIVIFANQCMLRMTADRAEELEDLLTWLN